MKVAVYLESAGDKLKLGGLAALKLARPAGEITIFCGSRAAPCAREQLLPYGPLLFVTLPDHPESKALSLADYLLRHAFTDCLAESGLEGRDLLARTAALLDAPLLLDCVNIDLAAGTAEKMLAAGRLSGRYAMPGPLNFYGLRPNLLPLPTPGPERQVESGPAAKFEFAARFKILRRTDITDVQSISDAAIVVAGGRPVGRGFDLLQRLADALGGSVGATRSAADAGYAPFAAQVGQTGAVISPRLYLAFAISGSIYHMAGIKTARTIVSVNSDRSAPIFRRSDFGLVADLFVFIPALLAMLRCRSKT